MSEQLAAKIAALLAKAESTTFDAERDAFLEKAAELMAKHSIDAAMLDEALGRKGQASQDKIIQVKIDFEGIYGEAELMMIYRLARATGLIEGWTSGKKRLVLLGHESDLQMFAVLQVSMRLQLASAIKRFVKENKTQFAYLTAMEKFKERRTFIQGFTAGAAERIRDAHAKTAVATGNGAELVLLDRATLVRQAMPPLGNRRGGSTASGSSSAFGSGAAAGRNSDVGQARVGAGGRAIGR